MSNATPAEIERVGQESIRITWDDGRVSDLANRALRLDCACASCIDEITGARRLRDDQVPEQIWPTAIELVGHYAISITWSDGHDTGIYTFDRLRQFAGGGG